MPRKARIDYPGLTHHVMARTFHDLFLFKDDHDRSFYLSMLSHRINEVGFLCYAWALMNTHVHLLVKTSEKPLWKLMKPLNADYARYYNGKYERRGPLFIDRYKSIATQDQAYLEQLLRYIHLNPLRAGVCKNLDQLGKYRWTGHPALLGLQTNDFQETHAVLRRFGRTPDLARRNYLDFLIQAIEAQEPDPFLDTVRAGNANKKDRNAPERWVIGDPEFQKSVLQRDRTNRLTLARYKKEGLTLDGLATVIAKKTGVRKDLILRRSKRTMHADARMILCHHAIALGFPTREIGAFLGIQQAAVSNAARKGEMIAKKKNYSII